MLEVFSLIFRCYWYDDDGQIDLRRLQQRYK